ncbi:universal stress protein [Gaiella occulta]|uniref:universal stress protein n=1 Tax=Gaiella occulta TaxID=1002870 RepID=UPI001C68775C|nr:universal stress protein [Gaiella occulta]
MIVVGIDGSDVSKEALRLALYEAALRGTRVRAVHAWLPVLPVALTGPGVVPPIDIEPIRDAAAELLSATVAAVAGEKAADVELAAVEGHAAGAILENAHDAELIVVGQRGHGAIKTLVLGSVSHDVVQHARCPVLVVPAPRD